MDPQVLGAAFGVLGTFIVGLLGLIGVLVRRNGKANPNGSLNRMSGQLDHVVVDLVELKAAIVALEKTTNNCDLVMRARQRHEPWAQG
jgi:hypothetical protein